MSHYSVATTKDMLSSLIDKAQAGEEVVITRRGKPAVRLVPINADELRRKDVAAAHARLREQRAALPPINAAIPYERFYEWLYEEPEA